ncbi:MAG: undecaprenyl-diphosphate phosphatase [Opitutaceae bacterium]
MLTLLKIVVLGLIQGAAELLPVSSSAHVVVAEKLMGVDPSTPAAMFVLAMLHTGTMFAVLIYFWGAWKERYFSSRRRFAAVAGRAALATVITGILGYALIKGIEVIFLKGGDVEQLARSLPLVAVSLVASGAIILYAGARRTETPAQRNSELTPGHAAAMGLIQAVCLPFRGFSRSGATISAGIVAGAGRRPSEEFSFALAIILTPAVIVRELGRLVKLHPQALHRGGGLAHLVGPGFLGLGCSFLAGLLALRWLSRWLEQGRWSYFGVYCLVAAAVVGVLAAKGF